MMSHPAAPLTIYGDAISGNCLKVKFVADALGIAYRWIETSVLEKKTRTPEFLAINPVGQVGGRFSRKAQMPSSASAASMFSVMTWAA